MWIVVGGSTRSYDVAVNCDGKVVVGFDSSSDSDIAVVLAVCGRNNLFDNLETNKTGEDEIVSGYSDYV